MTPPWRTSNWIPRMMPSFIRGYRTTIKSTSSTKSKIQTRAWCTSLSLAICSIMSPHSHLILLYFYNRHALTNSKMPSKQNSWSPRTFSWWTREPKSNSPGNKGPNKRRQRMKSCKRNSNLNIKRSTRSPWSMNSTGKWAVSPSTSRNRKRLPSKSKASNLVHLPKREAALSPSNPKSQTSSRQNTTTTPWAQSSRGTLPSRNLPTSRCPSYRSLTTEHNPGYPPMDDRSQMMTKSVRLTRSRTKLHSRRVPWMRKPGRSSRLRRKWASRSRRWVPPPLPPGDSRTTSPPKSGSRLPKDWGLHWVTQDKWDRRLKICHRVPIFSVRNQSLNNWNLSEAQIQLEELK